MFSVARRLQKPCPCFHQLQQAAAQHYLRHDGPDAGQYLGRRRPRQRRPVTTMKKETNDKSEWWVVDGEMHEIGENVPLRERFVIPRDNIPNRRRKQLREQFMRRTRLVIKDSDHEPWCKQYMQLYNEMRENWERLYWDEGYSKKLAVAHANYDSPEDEDDDGDFSPYRRGRTSFMQSQDQGSARSSPADNWGKVNQIRDKFEYDRERRMRDKAFAPMNMANAAENQRPPFRNQPFDARRYFSEDEDE